MKIKLWGQCSGVSAWFGDNRYELQRNGSPIAEASTQEAINAAWRLLVSTMVEDTAVTRRPDSR